MPNRQGLVIRIGTRDAGEVEEVAIVDVERRLKARPGSDVNYEHASGNRK